MHGIATMQSFAKPYGCTSLRVDPSPTAQDDRQKNTIVILAEYDYGPSVK
jgi:hypothetical protein